MAQNDNLKRYLDAGMAFTQLTRDRAEALVNDLVKAGEIRRKEAQQQIEELLERSQKNSEFLVGVVRKEVADQLRNLGFEDLARRAGAGSDETTATSSAGTTDSGATQTSAPVADPPSAAKKAAGKKAGGTKKTAPAAKATKAAPTKKASGKKSGAPPA